MSQTQNNSKSQIKKEFPKTPERLVFIPKTFDDLDIVTNSKAYCKEKNVEQYSFLLEALMHQLKRVNYPPNLQLTLFNYQEEVEKHPFGLCEIANCKDHAIASGNYRPYQKDYKLCSKHYMLLQTQNSIDWREFKLLKPVGATQ